MAGRLRKRGNSEGSIYKRRDGRWAVTLTLGYEGGKRRRKYLYGPTRRDVAERLNAALRDHQRGLAAPSERETVGHFLARWLEDVTKSSVRPTTFDGYERVVRLHLVPEIGRHRLARLSPQDVAGCYQRLLAKGLAPRYVHLVHAVLHRALSQAER